MKRVLCGLLAVFLLIGATGCSASIAPVVPDEETQDASQATQTPNSDAIVFDDAALEASIRQAIGKPEGDVTKAEAEAPYATLPRPNALLPSPQAWLALPKALLSLWALTL